MNVNSLSVSNWFQQLETRFMAGLQSTAATATSAASGSADSSQSATAAAAADPQSLNAASALPSNQFAPDLLSALISAQSAPPTSAQVAKGLISTLDGNGDGSLSLSEITSALSQTTGSTAGGGTSGLSAAFAKIDANGDGTLSADELAAALDTAVQDAQTQGPQRHHHHHHHGAQQASAQTATDAAPATAKATITASIDVSTATTTATTTGAAAA